LYGIDTRATQEIAEFQRIIDVDPALSQSGVRLSSHSASPKILWIRRHEPEVWAWTRLVVNGSGFLLYRLTGETANGIYDSVGFALFVDFEAGRYTEAMDRRRPDRVVPRPVRTRESAGGEGGRCQRVRRPGQPGGHGAERATVSGAERRTAKLGDHNRPPMSGEPA
jgi:xylulokinase